MGIVVSLNIVFQDYKILLTILISRNVEVWLDRLYEMWKLVAISSLYYCMRFCMVLLLISVVSSNLHFLICLGKLEEVICILSIFFRTRPNQNFN
jgi:hypothetical protein